MIDPDTGLSLGYQTSQIGYVQVSRIEDKFSIASVVRGTGGSKGDIVKLLEGGKDETGAATEDAAGQKMRNASAQGAPLPIAEGTVQILLSEISNYAQLVQFEKALKAVEGVQAVHRHTFSEGNARIDVKCAGNAQELADGLYLQDWGDFKVEITGFSANTLEISVK